MAKFQKNLKQKQSQQKLLGEYDRQAYWQKVEQINLLVWINMRSPQLVLKEAAYKSVNQGLQRNQKTLSHVLQSPES